ncbi:hypothetical protein IJ135_01745 [Candidatus Saccharibacteria bacterium]|nr:hypothetical protein [Candidatus Saccharibacteria bacterium]
MPSYRSPSQMWFFKKTAGAYRRLNVSITRAVQTLDIIMGDSRNKWIQVCQDFLNDVNCDSNQRKSAEILNNLLSNAGQEVDEEYLERSLGRNADNIDSPLTQQLYDRLNEYYADRLGKDLKIWCEVGWNMLIPDAESIEKNNRNVGFRIDIGIYSIKRKRFILGIEMDGATYHSGFRKEFSDLQRQAVLEKKGWNIYRIWSTNWLRDTEKEFQDLVKCIDGYLVGEYDDEDEMDNVDSPLGHDDEEELFIEEDSFEDMTKKMPDDYIGDVNGHDGIFYRPSDLFQANKYEVKLISTMKQHMEVGKPLEMKYSNTELSDNQKIATPYQMIYIKEIDEKDNFFLGSFSLTSSPYRIRLSDVFEYKIEPNVDESKRDDSENDAKSLDEKQAEVEIPEGESVVSEALLSFYLGHNVGEEISFRYQTNKQGSGEKWRNLKLIRYTEEYFWCRNLATDKVSMYRRDRVLEIKI